MISVVIPAYNEEGAITDCLDGLTKQTTDKTFEVILIDNNSTDNTVAIARTFEKKLNLRIVTEKRKGRGTARRAGFAQAQGNIILSTDADTVVPDNWIDTLSDRLTSSTSAIAVTGPCKIVDCAPLDNSLFNALQPFTMRIYRLLFGHYWLSGFNFGIYKKAYEKSGGFRSDLNAQEDIDLSFRVGKIGKITFISDMPVISSGRRFKTGLIGGSMQYFSTFIQHFWYRRNDIAMSDAR